VEPAVVSIRSRIRVRAVGITPGREARQRSTGGVRRTSIQKAVGTRWKGA
jgi:hypothetical protein